MSLIKSIEGTRETTKRLKQTTDKPNKTLKIFLMNELKKILGFNEKSFLNWT